MSTGIIDQAMNLLADHCVIDQGTSGDWVYRKYADGVSECWCTLTLTTTSQFNTWGNGYLSPNNVSSDFPTNLFTATPSMTVFLNGGYTALPAKFDASATSATNTGSIGIFRASQTSGTINWKLAVHAVGKWK